MTDTTIIQYQPASSPVLSSALTSLEQSLQAAARANVEAVLAASPDNDYTVTEIEAMTLIEQLKQVNGLDLAAVLLRGKYLRQIEASNAIANHPGGYTNLQEMARDQGISVAELSQTLALVNIVFPYVTETLGMNVYTLWEQIGKSNFRELVPALVSIITGEDSNSASVRGSVAAITAEVLEDAGVEEMPEDELRQRTVDQLLTDGAHLTNRQLRERIRPERTQVIEATLIGHNGTRVLVCSLDEDQILNLQRRMGGAMRQVNVTLPENPRQRQLEAARIPQIRQLLHLLEE
jgi:hypothetical protein